MEEVVVPDLIRKKPLESLDHDFLCSWDQTAADDARTDQVLPDDDVFPVIHRLVFGEHLQWIDEDALLFENVYVHEVIFTSTSVDTSELDLDPEIAGNTLYTIPEEAPLRRFLCDQPEKEPLFRVLSPEQSRTLTRQQKELLRGADLIALGSDTAELVLCSPEDGSRVTEAVVPEALSDHRIVSLSLSSLSFPLRIQHLQIPAGVKELYLSGRVSVGRVDVDPSNPYLRSDGKQVFDRASGKVLYRF